MFRYRRSFVLACLVGAGCGGDSRNSETPVSATGASSAGSDDTTTFSPATTTDDPGPADTSTSGDDGGTTGGVNFVDMPDFGGVANECDIWAQDCPAGEKCAPWANDGGSSWNATRCVPVDANPKQPGDPCKTDGSDVSGNDDCDLGSLCFAVDPETDIGHCVPMCQGSEANPSCDNPNQTCNISNNGSLILCLDACNPLAGDCPEVGQAQGCVPVNDDFLCWPVWQPGAVGEPCEYFNVCTPGTFCAVADAVPGCAGAPSCCTEFCDIAETDPNASCSMANAGAECVPWWTQDSPPGLEDLGGCFIP